MSLSIALEHFCRIYLGVDSSENRQLPQLLRDVAVTLDTGGADPDEFQKIRSHFLHATLTQAAASNKMSSVEEYVNNQLFQDSRKLNWLLGLLLCGQCSLRGRFQ